MYIQNGTIIASKMLNHKMTSGVANIASVKTVSKYFDFLALLV